jgi:hypothetical protein
VPVGTLALEIPLPVEHALSSRDRLRRHSDLRLDRRPHAVLRRGKPGIGGIARGTWIMPGGVGRVDGFAEGGRPGRRFLVAVVLNETAGLYSSYNHPRGKADLN